MESHWPPFPYKLRFGAHFVYPSPANSDAAQNAKAFLLGVKRDAYTAGSPPKSLIDRAVERVVGYLDSAQAPYADLFSGDVILVPVPGSAKSLPKSVSGPRTICLALERMGVGRTLSCIERTSAVQKSAFARPGERPDHQAHFDTMRIAKGLVAPSKILLVDDIVTRGATFLGAAARLRETFPRAEINAFALARTKQFGSSINEPCIGTIEVWGGEPHRNP